MPLGPSCSSIPARGVSRVAGGWEGWDGVVSEVHLAPLSKWPQSPRPCSSLLASRPGAAPPPQTPSSSAPSLDGEESGDSRKLGLGLEFAGKAEFAQQRWNLNFFLLLVGSHSRFCMQRSITRDRLGCQGCNPGQPCAREEPNPLYYSQVP